MKISLKRAEEIVGRFSKARILVVGDMMLDEFIWGKVSRISPEAPVPVVRVTSESLMPGGSANVVHNIQSLKGMSHVCGIIGNDQNGKNLKKILSAEGVNTHGFVVGEHFRTITKTRIIAHQQQVVRFDREDISKVFKKDIDKLIKYIKEVADDIDAIIIEDYGKGVVTQELVTEVIKLSERKNIIVTVDPKKDHFLNYTGATVLTPNYDEACEALGLDSNNEIPAKEIGPKLLRKLKSKAVLVTLGEKGMALFEKGKKGFFKIPTVAKEVYDVSGAGDTVIAAFTLSLISGATMEEAAIISNQAAGVVVAKLGTAILTGEELLQSIKNYE